MIDYIRITPEGHIRVTSAAPFDYIVSYTALPDINKMVGDSIALPNTVVATRKSGAVETLIVKWEPASTEVAGTFYISGSVGNGAGVVTQKVIVSQLSDLDILRQIRDANPTSQLPSLWLDSEDPYTQWEGVQWDVLFRFVTTLSVGSRSIVDFNKINQLKHINTIQASNNLGIGVLLLDDMPSLISVNLSYNGFSGVSIRNNLNLQYVNASFNIIDNFFMDGAIIRDTIYVNNNKLLSIPSLSTRGTIDFANFTHNLMTSTEIARLLALGFTTAQVLPQDI